MTYSKKSQDEHDACDPAECEQALRTAEGADVSDEMRDVLVTAFETDGTGCEHTDTEPACFDCLADIALRTIREGRAR